MPKREDGEWNFAKEMEDRPEGTEIKTMQMDADTTLMHITFPADIPAPDIEGWAKSFREGLPENVRAIFTMEGIEIKVLRPKKVVVNFVDSTFDNQELMDGIRKSLTMGKDANVEINFGKCVFQKKPRSKKKSSIITPGGTN